MKKILSVQQVREADAYTIEHEPVSSVDLMERAGAALTDALCGMVLPSDKLAVVAGRGNNGGDGLVMARRLLNRGYDVTVFLVGEGREGSADFVVNLERLEGMGVSVNMLLDGFDPALFAGFHRIVDALFGSGLARPVTGLIGEVIEAMNDSPADIVAIDMPSGLFADAYTDPSAGSIAQAAVTLKIEVPSLALLMPSCYRFTGDWQIVPIGLHPEYMEQVESPYALFTFQDARKLFRPKGRVSHKGSHGHALLLAGSPGKGGAALLAAGAALKSGAGLLTAAIPRCLESPFYTALPEAMHHLDPLNDLTALTATLGSCSAIAMGPGLGTGKETADMVHEVMKKAEVPMVLDADALNTIAGSPEMIRLMPKHTILTPHPKEFERLAGETGNDFERLRMAVDFACEHKVVIVLKTAYPVVITPDGLCVFNTLGNAGLAKGGSGDTLTGIILALLSRGYHPWQAARLGVYLHARAASLVAMDTGLDAMMPTEVTLMLGTAFKELECGKLLKNPGH